MLARSAAAAHQRYRPGDHSMQFMPCPLPPQGAAAAAAAPASICRATRSQPCSMPGACNAKEQGSSAMAVHAGSR